LNSFFYFFLALLFFACSIFFINYLVFPFNARHPLPFAASPRKITVKADALPRVNPEHIEFRSRAMKQFSRLAAMGMLAICALPAAARPQSIGQLATYNALAADDSAPRALRVNDQPIDRELLVQPHVGDFSARITLSQGKALLPLTAQQERGAYADPARVQISQNPDGSSTLRFPASDKTVVFNVVDFQAVGAGHARGVQCRRV